MDFIRSLLFIPGNRPNMLEKGAGFPADALVLDLEDSVPTEEKSNARGIVSEFVPKLAGKRLFVRVNGMRTRWVEDDIQAIVSRQIDGISIGKMESAAMARELSALLSEAEKKKGVPEGHTKVIAWIETAKGVLAAREVAEASPRILALAFGAEDFTADMGIIRTKTGHEVAAAKAITAMAARAADVLAFDTPDPDFKDIPGLITEATQAKALGFKGKFAIHPAQIAPINELFQPSKAEIEHARRVVAVFEEAKAKGSAAIALDGKMVDTPVWKRAVKVLEVADAMERGSDPKT